MLDARLYIPLVKPMSVEVELAAVEPKVVGVQAKAAPLVRHDPPIA